MPTSALQAPKLGPLENLGWTALSITAAAVLLPAIGVKALSRAVFPKPAANADERHYLIQ
ncbi:hypothetical protein [Arthrobacter sp. FW306-07-I]|uniref:hypothetical protein n=1 Tax=Arthrobacter sp. FW306-07-I TaxID=2879622 RepID=UPI001F2667F8|nr:hypothetical protein [Arthrobacter sp. FW306-07-I]UKA74535.1 hypothetical protein LFT46_15400 [Arthrobacter sp. FW306-07-I]